MLLHHVPHMVVICFQNVIFDILIKTKDKMIAGTDSCDLLSKCDL